jgi:hypothetical protein
MTPEFIKKVEESFSTLQENNGIFFIHEELVNKMWNKDTDKEQILTTVNNILNLFNNSSYEKQTELYNSEIIDVINLINH